MTPTTPTPAPAPTPRTDALIQKHCGSMLSSWWADFARTLERELTSAQAALAAKDAEIDKWMRVWQARIDTHTELLARAEKAEAELAQILTDKNYVGGVCYWVTKHDEALLRETQLRAEVERLQSNLTTLLADTSHANCAQLAAAQQDAERLIKRTCDSVRGILRKRSAGETNTWGFVAMFMEMIDEAEQAAINAARETKPCQS